MCSGGLGGGESDMLGAEIQKRLVDGLRWAGRGSVGWPSRVEGSGGHGEGLDGLRFSDGPGWRGLGGQVGGVQVDRVVGFSWV